MRIFTFVAALLFVFATTQFGAAQAADTRYRVCLDPGHGGSDPGAVYGGLEEKHLNLDIARRVEVALGSTLYVTQLTRTGDTALGNSDRAAICNAFGAQVVLSIHLNASTDRNVDYVWFFYGKPQKDKAFAATMDREYAILRPDSSGLPLLHKPITNFANGTLLKSRAPAALAEGLFMSNADEIVLLADDSTEPTAPPNRRQQIANELVKGLRAWAMP